jgi:hypothetical protein
MVWSKIATLQTTYSYEDIYAGHNYSPSRAWHYEQMDWIAGLLETECGFTKRNHPDYSNTASRRSWVLETPQFKDLRTGALTSWYWWMYTTTENFGATVHDPYLYRIMEGGYGGNPPTSPGTSYSYRSSVYYANDGGDRYARGVVTAWKSSLNPGALMILTGNPYLTFYWPGPNEAYRPYAADPEPWKYQGALLPWGQYGASSAGNPTGEQSSDYYSYNGRPTAFIDSYRGSVGASNDRDDPGQTANGALLYQDYWMVHNHTKQPIYQAPRDVAVYSPGPTSGGQPEWTGQTNSSYKYYRTVGTAQVDGNYWLTTPQSFWFNVGPTQPDFGTSPWAA